MNTKEKKLAIALAGGLIVSNLGVVTASADTNVANNNSILVQNQQVNYPTVTQQTIKFDENNPKDLVVTGIDYFNQQLDKFTVADGEKINELDVNKLKYDDNKKTLTIPADLLKALNLSDGMHACGLTFSDGTLYVGAITIYATNSNTSTTPPTTPVVPPSNGGTDVKPPTNVTANPTVEEQILEYYKSNPQNIVIEDVNYDGTELEFIYIGSNFVDAKDLVLDKNTITIPAKVLSTLTLVSGNYDISFKFSNGTSVIGNVYLAVKDSSIIAAANDNDSEVAIDINNVKPVEQQKPFVPSEDKENVKNPSSDNKNESSIRTSNTVANLPNTGYAVTSSFIGTIVTGIGAVLFRRKK